MVMHSACVARHTMEHASRPSFIGSPSDQKESLHWPGAVNQRFCHLPQNPGLGRRRLKLMPCSDLGLQVCVSNSTTHRSCVVTNRLVFQPESLTLPMDVPN